MWGNVVDILRLKRLERNTELDLSFIWGRFRSFKRFMTASWRPFIYGRRLDQPCPTQNSASVEPRRPASSCKVRRDCSRRWVFPLPVPGIHSSLLRKSFSSNRCVLLRWWSLRSSLSDSSGFLKTCTAWWVKSQHQMYGYSVAMVRWSNDLSILHYVNRERRICWTF